MDIPHVPPSVDLLHLQNTSDDDQLLTEIGGLEKSIKSWSGVPEKHAIYMD